MSIESTERIPSPQRIEAQNSAFLNILETYATPNRNNTEENTDTSLEGYLRKITKIPTLTQKEESDLLSNGDEDSLDVVVEAHLKLVATVSRRWFNKENVNVDLSDLIQEGNIALINATRTFDPTKGYNFEGWATLLINQSIGHALVRNYPIHIPPETIRLMRSLQDTYTVLQTKLQRNPTAEEIAKEMKTDRKYIEKLIMRIPQDFTSLSGNKIDIEDTESQEDIEDIITQIDIDSFKKHLPDLLSQLSDREREVIKLRFGLQAGTTQTLEEVGKKLALTRERIRQIESMALKKLRQKI
jgi:RNA polymerase primary sigma factor